MKYAIIGACTERKYNLFENPITGTIFSNHVQLIKPNLQPFTMLRGEEQCPNVQAPSATTIFNKVNIALYGYKNNPAICT